MKKNPCGSTEDKLVDYADGELPEKEMAVIESHLAVCSKCRQLVVDLNRSLGACQVIWHNKLAEGLSHVPEETPAKRRRFAWYAGLAASVLILIAVGFTGYAQKWSRAAAIDRVQRQVEDAGRAARLLAVADLLRERCGYDDLVERKYQYIVKTFPSTDFAEAARSRLR